MSKSVYIHIPFCRNICSYCDFCKLLYKKDWADLYLNKLNETKTHEQNRRAEQMIQMKEAHRQKN